MKISKFIKELGEKFHGKLKIVRKGIFRILINEQAFFLAKEFSMKITKLDKETIKVGFPDSVKDKWLRLFESKKFGYVLFELRDNKFTEVGKFNGKSNLFDIDIENFDLTRQRILGLLKLGIEQKTEKNFLLKDKLESIYDILTHNYLRF